MKGILKSKTAKSWTNPEGTRKDFWEVEVEGQPWKAGCWQYDKLTQNVGEEIEYTATEKNGRWSLTLAGAKTGGGFQSRGKSQEELQQQVHSFACSYAKDVAVACIEKGIVADSKGIDAAILHWNNLFLGIMKG